VTGTPHTIGGVCENITALLMQKRDIVDKLCSFFTSSARPRRCDFVQCETEIPPDNSQHRVLVTHLPRG
jgi:hypothetical protein